MAHTGDKALGKRLRERRRAKGMSLAEVGAALSKPVSARTVLAYEYGEIQPGSIQCMRELADVLDTSVAYLVGECDKPAIM